MGNSMACCGKSDTDPNNVNTSLGYNQGLHLDIKKIIRIQAMARGFLVRMRHKKSQ